MDETFVREFKKPTRHVRFNEVVQVVTLPYQEAQEAWRARFGPYRSAPTHDTIWDGFEQKFRDREITKKELKRLLYESRVRRVLPYPLARAFIRRKKDSAGVTPANGDAGSAEKPRKRDSLLRRLSLTKSGQVKKGSGSETPRAAPVQVVVVDEQAGEVAEVAQEVPDSEGSRPRRISDLEDYFNQVDRMDGLWKSSVPRRNYSWTDELIKLTMEWLKGDLSEADSVSGRSESSGESDMDGPWQYLSLSWMLRKLRQYPNESGKAGRRSSEDSEASTAFEASPPGSPAQGLPQRRPHLSEEGTLMRSGKVAARQQHSGRTAPATPRRKRRDSRSPLELAGKQLVEDLYDLAVRLSGLDDL